MSEPSKPDDGLGLVLVALIDVLMIMPDLPPHAERGLRDLKDSILHSDMTDVRRDALALSAWVAMAKRNIGR
jgi:hypothetical protein